jgi:ribosome-associated translation inhibitor RaiA
MQTPVQISFHGLDKSDAVETRIREKVAKLEQFYDRITSCRVVVERHHSASTNATAKDQPFHISIILEVPGEELVYKRDPKSEEALKDHQDINIALRDAFAAMQRQLKEYKEIRRSGRQEAERARNQATI